MNTISPWTLPRTQTLWVILGAALTLGFGIRFAFGLYFGLGFGLRFAMHILSMLAIIILLRLQRFALGFALGVALGFALGLCFRSAAPALGVGGVDSFYWLPGQSATSRALRVTWPVAGGTRHAIRLANESGHSIQNLLVNALLRDDQKEGEANNALWVHHALVDKQMMYKHHVLLDVNHAAKSPRAVTMVLQVGRDSE